MSDRTAIIAERIVGILLVLGALVLPWLLLVKFRRILGPWPAFTALSAAAALFVSVAGLLFGVCAYPGPPGVGAVPRAAKRRADVVGAALASYRSSAHRYPSTLEDLVPVYLTDTVLSQFHAVVGSALDYRTDTAGRSFRLEFHYAGPGLNSCYRTDTALTWQCSGLF